MIQAIKEYLSSTVTPTYGVAATDILTLVGIAVAAAIFYFATFYLLKHVERAIERKQAAKGNDPTNINNKRTEDNKNILRAVFDKKILRAVSQLAPAVVVKYLLPKFFGDGSYLWLDILTSLYILAVVVFILVILINKLYEPISKSPRYKALAVKGLFQMAQLVCVSIAIIYAISMILGCSPTAIFTTLGASAAVLMLIFKDTLLGLVASIQLTANDMIHKDDWVVCEPHQANGEVEEISLTTVKIRNWDKSITTIPPYRLVSESFRNYQPMRDSGGRRVDRSVIIDANSVRFLNPTELSKIKSKGWLKGPDGTEIEIDDASQIINLSLLRRYLTAWLTAHPNVKSEQMLMVRQLEHTSSGLPLQLYFFCDKVEWTEFEEVQNSIFDHVYAIIGEFGLRIFQSPSGTDLQGLKS